ncbi:hypothetical protein F5Y12DRAFT_728583 [Xylaria sp. FL1777]|nr:hypothetical protein F5Y12DRAFT_728583 [Xylaria sp. FL1777]
MAAHSRRRVPDVFDSSICPEPGAFSLIAFTIISVVWIFCQICISFQPSKKAAESSTQNSYNTTTHKVIVSTIYTIVLGILLLDGCWLTTMYIWAIKRLSTAPIHGFMDLSFTVLVVVIWCAFVLLGFVAWFWTLRVMAKQVLTLWDGRGSPSEKSDLDSVKSLT